MHHYCIIDYVQPALMSKLAFLAARHCTCSLIVYYFVCNLLNVMHM